MKHIWKRLSSFVLAWIMVVTMTPVSGIYAFAMEKEEEFISVGPDDEETAMDGFLALGQEEDDEAFISMDDPADDPKSAMTPIGTEEKDAEAAPVRSSPAFGLTAGLEPGGDYAYISNFEIDSIEDGVGNFDAAENIAHMKDESGNWQTVESPGNDSSGSNGKVRTYDSIIYHLEYTGQVYGEPVKNAKAFFRFVLPLTAEEAVWDLDDMNWLEDPVVTEEEIDDVTCQVLTGYRLLTPGEDNSDVFPGWGTLRATVKVLRMENEAVIKPTFSIWLENNAEEEVVVLETEDHPITVTCAPKYNVQLKHSIAGGNAKGEYDFSTGNELALDKDAGTVFGRIQLFGITLQLYNDRPDKGLLGLDFPSGDITFDLDLSTFYTPDGETAETDVTSDFAPLVWGYGPQETGNEDVGGRNLRIYNTYAAASDAAPFNAGGDIVGTSGSERCKNGGTWSATKTGNTIHFTVSGYEIDPQYFPNTDANTGNTAGKTYYDPKNGGYNGIDNIGCFSAGKLYIVVPFEDSEGTSIGTSGMVRLHLEDKNLMAEGLSASVYSADNQMKQSDDMLNANLHVGIAPGSFNQYALWSTRERLGRYDVFNGQTHIYTGQDWAMEGSRIAITWASSNSTNYDAENTAIARRSLMKFDPDGVTPTGEVFCTLGEGNRTLTYKILFAAKADGTAWDDDDEMLETKMEDLVYYESFSDLQDAGKICVGMLLEVDPAAGVSPDKVDAFSSIGASAYVTVNEGATRLETYMCTAESRVWRLSQYESDPAFTVPSLLGNDPGDPTVLPAAAAAAGCPDGEYIKAYYYTPNGGYWGGHNNSRWGDSLLVVETKAAIRQQIMQTMEGTEEPKTKYDLDHFERTVDFGLYPRLTNSVGTAGEEAIIASGKTVTVTVQDILPAGLHYVEGSACCGGIYTQNEEAGRPGTVTESTPKEPDIISVDPDTGAETLTWTFTDVTVNGDMDPIYFSAAIGNTEYESKDVKNGDRLQTIATIRVTGDYRDLTAINGNRYDEEIIVSKLLAGSLSKIADEEYVETAADGLVGFTLVQSNISSSRMDSVILDTLPYDGDELGSAFDGTYTVEEFTINNEVDNIAGWKVYYTTDTAARGTFANEYTKEGIESGASVLEDESTVTWTEVDVNADGTVPDLEDETPTAIAIICSISGNKRFEAHLTLKKDLYADEKFINTLSCLDVSTLAKTEVIGRSLEGCLWIDADANGSRGDEEELPDGIEVALLKWDPDAETYSPVLLNGEPVTCVPGKVKDVNTGAIADGEAGHYMFTGVPAGTFAVKFESAKLDFSNYRATEKEKEGVSEELNSNADGNYNEDGDLEYTQIDGIEMETKEQLIREGVITYASQYNDSGIYRLAGGLKVSKIVLPEGTGGEKTFSFTVTLGDDSINGTYGEMTFEDGVAEFELSDGESVTAAGLPAGISYTVEEEDYSDIGYTTSAEGDSGTISGEDTAEAVFTNTYEADPVSVQFKGTKTFTGYPETAETVPEFTITLSEDDEVLQSATVSNGDYAFDSIEYEETGVHTYVIQETNDGLPGITYDTKTYTVTVTVTDNGSGKLIAEISGSSETGEDLDFTNTYNTDSVSVQFKGTKTFTGYPETAETVPEFTITLSEDGEVIQSATVSKGAYAFDSIEYEETGVHTYVIQETNDGLPGITYDTKTYTVVVTVTDDLEGKLVAEISGSSETGEDLDFTNTYEADSVSVQFKGTKTFTGYPETAETVPEFTITLSENDEVIQSATVSSGAYAFDSIEYEETGVHTYVIQETNDGLPGITYDTKTYTVVVTVTDNGSGKLIAEIDGDSENLDFTNDYEADSVSVQFEGRKTLMGRTLEDKEFSFTFTGEEDDVNETVKNTADGKITFTAITYTEPGTYTYTVKEEAATKSGVTIDSKVYNLTVTVTDNGSGKLVAEIDGDSENLDFTNTYEADPVSVQFKGTKTFTGYPETAETVPEFTITLSENGEVLQSATVSSGAYAFDSIEYEETGVHTYVIQETNDGLPGITYDTKTYTVTVTVTDDGSGKLIAEISGGSETGEDLDFTNIYEADPVSVQFEGRKTLTGRTLEDKEFSFTLTGEEDDVNETVKNTADGKITFTAITYTEPGVYTYTVKEEAATKSGVTIDSKVYNLTVTVTDNGSGKLVAEISGGSTTGKDLNFTNIYKADPVSVQFKGTKTFTGYPETAETVPEFTITLSEDGEVLQSVTVSSGDYAFDSIEYEETGVHTYVIQETNDGLPGITYDTKTYTVTVTVTDDLEGKLVAEISGSSTTGEDLNFTNTYNTDSVNVQFKGTKIQFKGTKTFTGYPETAETVPEFTITLSENDEVLQSVTVSSGAYAFDSIEYEETGVHTYVIQETNDGLPGITYDTKTYTVTVTVTDDGSGKLVAGISGSSTTGEDLNFTNTYEADPVSVQFEGKKTLKGRTLKDEEFSFTLKGEEDGVDETVKNEADGKITFTAITYTEPGVYTYTVKEEKTKKSGITIDSKVYELTVTVTDNGSGKLVAEISGDSETGKDLNFTNRYTPPEEPSTGSLVISKTVKGDLGDKTQRFAFVVRFDADGEYHYSGSESGTIESGDTIWLKDGEEIEITGLPDGTTYKVTESDSEGYTVSSTGSTGTIEADHVSKAAFTNTKSSVPYTGDGSSFVMWAGFTGICLVGLLLTLWIEKKKA